MQKNIVITGASGLIATELIHLLLDDDGEYHIYAITTHPGLLQERYNDVPDITCLSLEEFRALTTLEIESVIHCAFSRSNDAKEIAESLQYTSKVHHVIKKVRPKLFVNVSSQSVYGQDSPPFWTEQTPPAPNHLYALGKLASEEITSAFLTGTGIKFTNIRLSSVCENARFLYTFIRNALTGIPINVQGGRQKCSFIDVRDAAGGIKTLIERAHGIDELNVVYNLSLGSNRTILELANDVKRIVEGITGIRVEVNVSPSDIKFDVGMDNSLFCDTFSWHPMYGYDDMIRYMAFLIINESEVEFDIPLK